MKYTLFFVLILSFWVPLFTQAQYFGEEYWHQGRVELSDGAVHEGQVKYSLKDNIVQFKGEGLVRNYTISELEYFQFHDKMMSLVRHFYVLEYERRKLIFELIYNGRVGLLNREQLIVRYANFGGRFGMATPVTEVQDDYFLLLPSLKIKSLPSSRRAFVDELPDYQNRIDLFIREENIRMRRLEDVVAVLQYYNQLATGQID